jgi:hypothetical protein
MIIQRQSRLSAALVLTRLVLGPAIAALILWAANELYKDPLLAGFIYALCCFLLVGAWALSWFAEAASKEAPAPHWAALERIAGGAFVTCVLVSLAYAALPLPLVAASVVILFGAWIEAARGAEAKESEWTSWRTSAEMSGVAAFLAARASTLLSAPENIIVGLDWAATILLWAAAVLALIGAYLFGATKMRSVGTAELDHVQNENRDDKNTDGNERGHALPRDS